jgi:hypothetical protein
MIPCNLVELCQRFAETLVKFYQSTQSHIQADGKVHGRRFNNHEFPLIIFLTGST